MAYDVYVDKKRALSISISDHEKFVQSMLSLASSGLFQRLADPYKDAKIYRAEYDEYIHLLEKLYITTSDATAQKLFRLISDRIDSEFISFIGD